MLILGAATALLGRWQLSRAAQKEAVFAATVQRGALPVLDGRALRAALGGLPLDPAANPTAVTAETSLTALWSVLAESAAPAGSGASVPAAISRIDATRPAR